PSRSWWCKVLDRRWVRVACDICERRRAEESSRDNFADPTGCTSGSQADAICRCRADLQTTDRDVREFAETRALFPERLQSRRTLGHRRSRPVDLVHASRLLPAAG